MEITSETIVIGCNYHLKWQSNKAMRFILVEISDNRVRMKTRHTNSNFWTDKSDLIFIMSNHNIKKAKDIIQRQTKQLKIH